MRKQIPIEPKGLEPIGLEMTPERKAQFENDKARIEARKSAGEHSTHDLPAGDPGSDLRRHDGSPASAPRRNHLYPVEDAELTRKPPITEGYRAEAHFPEVAHTGRPRENAVRPQTRSDITQVHHVSESWVPDSESLERPSQGERIGEDPEPESSGQSWQKLIFADRPGWDQPEADDPTWEPKPKNAGSDPAGDRDASRDTPTKTDSIIGSDSDPKQGRRMDASEAEEHLAMAAADEDLDRALEEVGAKRTSSLTDRQVAQMEQALSQVRDQGSGVLS